MLLLDPILLKITHISSTQNARREGRREGGKGEKRKPGVLRVIRERRDSYFYNFSVKTGQNQHPKRQLAPGEKTEVSGLKNKRIDFRASTGTQK